MNFFENHNLVGILKNVLSVFAISLSIMLFAGIYLLGLIKGYNVGHNEAQEEFVSYLSQQSQNTISNTLSPTPKPQQSQQVSRSNLEWGGPELWNAVNIRRQELGVNALNQRDELCTIASIRLNELLELGKLDGHEGFSNMAERRPDLKWIFDRYSTIAEFLAVGGDSPQETISLWENTLGHKKLLTGGEYVWGCIYAQDTFAVAITAF